MRFSRSILLSLMACRLAFAVGPRCDQADQLLCAKGGNGVYDVKAFGAFGDGTTDDTAAIYATFAAAPEGAEVFFPAGTYVMDPVSPNNRVIKSGMLVRG